MIMKTKKAIALTAAISMVLPMGSTVFGYENELDLNQKVSSLYVNGINYNASDREESIAGVSYDPSSNTLTINNVNIILKAGYDFISYYGDIPLNVVVTGTNNIKSLGSYNEDGSEKYPEGSFIDTNTYSDNVNFGITVSGSGTVNLENIRNIIYGSYFQTEWNCNYKIDGITINGISTGGIEGRYANLDITNSTIKLNNASSNVIVVKGIIDIGSNITNYSDADGNGTVNISNSVLEYQASTGDMREPIVECKILNLNNENIYAGTNNAENLYTIDQFLSKKTTDYQQELTYYCPEQLGYALITSSTLNLPALGQNGNNNATNNTDTTTNTTGNNETKNNTNQTNVSVNENSAIGVKPSKVKNLKAINVNGKKAKISWKKVNGAVGYHIMYSTNKKFSKGVKHLRVDSTSKIVGKLKKNKTYYFKVRACVKSGNQNLFGKWSGIKKVKIKK